jgi:hypothetical protein
MLNLVQLQERLKDVPMQALMQYANGTNPQVPPFLALGELNRRKKMQESAAADQAQEMEGSTVKQQIEQAAGLLALQGSRQRQAAQQQQGMQAKAPMPAPNTTTSEPAQLAGGGFIDDLVVPRDFQAGGQAMNPELLKRLMMMKAMQKKRPGLTGLPMQPDMFKRGDYAGGGIVAFQGGGSTFGGFEMDQDSSPVQGKATKEQIEAMTLAELQEYNRTGIVPARVRSAGLTDRQQSIIEDARDRAMTDILSRGSARQAPGQAPGQAPAQAPGQRMPAAERPAARPTGIAAINPATLFPVPSDFDEKKQLEKQEARKKLYGVSDEFLKEAEKGLEERIKGQQTRRGEQGMEQAIEFLSSMAEGRGGTFGTQAARGAKASSKLRAIQQEANEKQDEANAVLKTALAEKRQALARGDMQAAAQAETDIRAAQDAARKAQFDAQYKIEGLGIERQKAAAMSRDPVELQTYKLWVSQQKPGADTSYEAFKKAVGTADDTLMFRKRQAIEQALDKDVNYQLLKISPKPEDQRKAAQIRAARYAEEGISLGGSTAATGNRIRLDAQGNVIQ